ncbi:MAG: twin-arginine translocation signal domain-containing protein, partial [Oscillospiraceae bacterium]|nr:twin-arginine translocation signal domain-containing protein [Oscillospiraceae bacterium]
MGRLCIQRSALYALFLRFRRKIRFSGHVLRRFLRHAAAAGGAVGLLEPQY